MTGQLSRTAFGHVQHNDRTDNPFFRRVVLSSDVVRRGSFPYLQLADTSPVFAVDRIAKQLADPHTQCMTAMPWVIPPLVQVQAFKKASDGSFVRAPGGGSRVPCASAVGCRTTSSATTTNSSRIAPDAIALVFDISPSLGSKTDLPTDFRGFADKPTAKLLAPQTACVGGVDVREQRGARRPQVIDVYGLAMAARPVVAAVVTTAQPFGTTSGRWALLPAEPDLCWCQRPNSQYASARTSTVSGIPHRARRRSSSHDSTLLSRLSMRRLNASSESGSLSSTRGPSSMSPIPNSSSSRRDMAADYCSAGRS